ncbi:ATP-binding cassette domain-containing protein [bacterium]|nr:ATP-binding cassette domain-containing protein [bacterium]
MAETATLELRNVGKSYLGVKALRDVSLSIASGEIHALCGENGAGKSTLVEVLAGTIRPDQGSILLDGAELNLNGPTAALRAGIAVIHQELQLVGSMSVAENIVLGDENTFLGWLDRRNMTERSAEALRMLHADAISPGAIAGSLATGQRQIVEIARSLRRRARVLILDEPTAALTRAEAHRLAELLRRLRSQGLAIILVSHHLDEVLALSDRVSVLRDGQLVGTWPRNEIDHDGLVRSMIGREVGIHRKEVSQNSGQRELLTIQAMQGETVRDVDLVVNFGEVLGLTGLAGAGQEELARLMAGESLAKSGLMRLAGKAYRPRHPAQAQRLGVAAVPADRRVRGLIASLTLGRNLVLQRLRQTSRFGWLSWKRLGVEATNLCHEHRIKYDRLSQNPLTLSGGNQQKVLLARALATNPRLAILNEPTRGVDIGTREAIHRRIEELAATGVSVVVVSPDTQELERVADRVAVFRSGRIRSILEGDRIKERTILAEITGADER